MCAAFPTEVSCNIPYIGAAGGKAISNGLCVLTQNNINEKLYLVFWFWFVFMFAVSVFAITYRLVTILSEDVRFYLIYSKVGAIINPVIYLTMIVKIRHQYDADLKTHLQSILDQSQLGDWFVLYQLRYKTSHFL